MDHDAATATQAVAETSRFPLAIRSQRVLQVILGLFWILDAALQFQPFMFGQGFVDTFILTNANGQPFVLGDLITHIGNFVAPDIAVWNTFFALIQLFIGVGLLFRRTVRPALAVSFVWVLGDLGHRRGHGHDPHRHRHRADRRAGLGAAVRAARASWPGPGRPGATSTGATGPSASPRRRRPRASGAPSRRWPCGPGTGRWRPCCSSSPTTGPRTSVSSAIVGMAPGQPGWYAHFLTSLGNLFSTTGTQTAWVLAAVAARHRPRAAGGPPARVVPRSPARCSPSCCGSPGRAWSATSSPARSPTPTRGRSSIVLAAAMVPTVRAPRDVAFARRRARAAGPGGRGPRRGRARRRARAERQLPGAGGGVDRQRHGGHGDGRQRGGGASGSASQSATADTCVPHQVGLQIAGLDLANTPYMVMSGSNGMDMNGADASAAAGLNTTKPNWHYTGPALPQAEAQTLLADGNNGPVDIHMAESGCAARLTSAEDIGAQQYVQATSAAVARLRHAGGGRGGRLRPGVADGLPGRRPT